MEKWIFVVDTNASDRSREKEYNDWYDNVHLGEVLALQGFEAAQRFRVSGEPVAGNMSHQYVALYELDTETPHASLDALAAAVADGSMTMSEAIDTRDVHAVLIEPVTGRVMSRT